MESEARLVALDEQLAIPGEVKAEGLEYFLELHVAREVLEAIDEDAPTEKKAELLIFYAENDAYPTWLYE